MIIVDDGSTDDTELALQPFLEDQRIHYLKKANTGQADSLNVGARSATGEFITFLDSDDEAYPDWLATVANNIQADTGMLCAGAIRRFADGTCVKEGMKNYRVFGHVVPLKFTCGSLFLRREVFLAVGGYDASLQANIQTDLGYRVLSYFRNEYYKIVIIDAFLVQINIHEGERIRTNWKRIREGGIQFINKHYAFIYENDKKEISNIYAAVAFSCYKLQRKPESVSYLLKAIRHNPLRFVNYVRVIKYALL